MSAEYVVAHGNSQVMLCERGIRTFETATRNTCDISAVPVLNEMTHLPVIVDPSHATGKRSLVPALAKAAVAVGADGIIVEVHPCPEKAVSDGAQSLTIQGFRDMMRQLSGYIELWKQERVADMAVGLIMAVLKTSRRFVALTILLVGVLLVCGRRAGSASTPAARSSIRPYCCRAFPPKTRWS